MVECRQARDGFLLSRVQTFVSRDPNLRNISTAATPSVPQLASAIACLALLYFVAARLTGAGLVDDSYIFLRYGRNIWSGAGAVFNPGEYVEGYTSPLWLACATLIQGIGLAPPEALALASATTGILTIALVGLANPVSSSAARLLAAAFVASSPVFAYWSQTGMDTPLFALLLVASILSFEKQLRSGGSLLMPGVLLALTALTRLEAVTILGIMGLVLWRSGRRPLSRAAIEIAAPSCVLLGAHELWRHAYYGQWLPNTFTAKVGIPRSVLLGAGITYVTAAAKSAAPALVALAIAIRRASKSGILSLQTPALVIGWITLLIVLTGGDHFGLFRFFVPVVALTALLVGRIADTFVASSPRPMRAIVIGMALIVAVNGYFLSSPEVARARFEVVYARGWANTGRWCAANLPPGSLAATVVGAIPYFCDRPTVDLLGLTDAYIARHGEIFVRGAPGHQKFATDYVLGRQPDFIFFPSSGVLPTPLFRTIESRHNLAERSTHALMDLTTRPAIERDYVYQATPLDDGTWIELLRRRK